LPSATDTTAEQVIITIMTVRILWFVNVVSVQLIIRLNIGLCAEMLYIFGLTLFFLLQVEHPGRHVGSSGSRQYKFLITNANEDM